MIKHNQDGAVNGLVVSLVFAVLLLIGALGFGGWAFSERQDYKNNVDTKIQTAEEAARQKESAVKDRQFAEEAKKPLKAYQGPEAYGSLLVNFPKTWSAYVDDSTTSGTVLNGFFSPGTVPSATDEKSVFALRVQVVSQSYAEVLRSFEGQQEEGALTVSAYALPRLPKVVGVKATGELTEGKTVTMIVLPLRSQTLQIWTEGNQYLADFNDNILPNFSFSP
ncbi:MAG: hypothetical protein M3N35_02975 [Candidatus Binatota bacterium]|nr:hypothetical protein [Candidatus Binatota bacterium]